MNLLTKSIGKKEEEAFIEEATSFAFMIFGSIFIFITKKNQIENLLKWSIFSDEKIEITIQLLIKTTKAFIAYQRKA